MRACLLTWFALLVLLALSAGSSLLPLGVFNIVGNFAIAKAALVLVVFMRIGRSAPMAGIVAGCGVLLLSFLIGVGVADVLSRG